MSLADDISNRVTQLRQQHDDVEYPFREAARGKLQHLQSVVDDWARRHFWDQDEGKQAEVLESAMAADPGFRKELAEALAWDQPKEDSAELTLLAVDFARDPKKSLPANVFGNDLDWNQWKQRPELRRMQELLANNTNARNALAKAVSAFPGLRHLRDIALQATRELASHGPKEQPVQGVLEQFLLNLKGFQARLQDEQFRTALASDFNFREDVARAIELQSTEAALLAQFAVYIWGSVPQRCLLGKSRAEMLGQLRDWPSDSAATRQLVEILQPSVGKERELDWDHLRAQLADAFARDPMLAGVLWNVMDWPRPFALVLREELRQVEARRAAEQRTPTVNPPAQTSDASNATDVSDLAAHKKLFAISFSGGGIRSATFNLGVLQKLNEFGLLTKADYLSTVSGGGYIGGWLTGWIRHCGKVSFEEFTARMGRLLSPKVPDPRADEQKPIRFLREFSNYLTPTLGAFSFDTWTMVAVYTRNVILNQAILVSLLGALLLIPRFLEFPLDGMGPDQWMWIVAVCGLVLAVTCISLNMQNAVRHKSQPASEGRLSMSTLLYQPLWIQLLVVVALLLSVYFGSLWLWRHIYDVEDHPLATTCTVIGFATGLSLLLSCLGGFVHRHWGRLRSRTSKGILGLIGLLALITIFTAGTAYAVFRAYLYVVLWLHSFVGGVWHAEIWGPVMLLAVLIIPGTLQVGLMGIDFPDSGREWLSRFRAVCTVYVIYWIVLTSAAIYGPYIVFQLTGPTVKGVRVWISGLTAGWIVTTITSLMAGKSGETGTDKDGSPKVSWLQTLAKLGPPVFIAGLILLIATGEQLLFAHGRLPNYHLQTLIDRHWEILEPCCPFGTNGWLLSHAGWLLVALTVAGGVLAWRIDINEFSMHQFYKNRLVRCYLGASNENRSPNPFTGFDLHDDFHLAELAFVNGEQPYPGPYPIINATLNLSAGKQLAWQERKGASFIFTPCFCGFDVQGWSTTTGSKAGQPKKHGDAEPAKCSAFETLKPHGYRVTRQYTQNKGPLLGTAISISGAAANPNQGYNTSPAVSFLMTMFDVRLGWWLGNPRRDSASMRSSPRFGLAALVSELLGLTDDETRFVNLSDGGHFDNMGLYELVRRRCSFIMLCDAEQDSEYKFEGLGSAIRKCRIDFGAIIEIDPVLIRPTEPDKKSETHCAVGKIRYLDGSEGTLVYVKSSLTGDEPEDVLQYHCSHLSFPHESTADQWFSESQFESYRALGYHAADRALSAATAWVKWDPKSSHPSALFEAMAKYWYPVNPNLRDSASKHTGTLAELLETIRKTPVLHALGSELFPNGTFVAAGSRSATEEFYFSMCIIQLMEDLYFDFQLDSPQWFDDPRIGGWRSLFKTWKSVPAVAAAWTAERDTFRKDFQVFWNSI